MMLAEDLSLTTYNAAVEVEFSRALDSDTAAYEFAEAGTDVTADDVGFPEDQVGRGAALPSESSPEAVRQLARLLDTAAINAPDAVPQLDTADDGGLLVELVVESTGREVLFAIAPDTATLYFSTNETPSLNGIVTLQTGLDSLVRWLVGAGQISRDSLLLPSK